MKFCGKNILFMSTLTSDLMCLSGNTMNNFVTNTLATECTCQIPACSLSNHILIISFLSTNCIPWACISLLMHLQLHCKISNTPICQYTSCVNLLHFALSNYDLYSYGNLQQNQSQFCFSFQCVGLQYHTLASSTTWKNIFYQAVFVLDGEEERFVECSWVHNNRPHIDRWSLSIVKLAFIVNISFASHSAFNLETTIGIAHAFWHTV